MSTPQPIPATAFSQWQLFETLLAPSFLNQLQPTPPQTAYTPWVVTWLLIYQRLHGNASLNDAVAHFLLRFPTHTQPDCKRIQQQPRPANNAAYSQARSKLDGRIVDLAARRIFDSLIDTYPPSWKQRRAFILDGTTLSLAPTNQLRKTFPPASNQYGTSHWPILHM